MKKKIYIFAMTVFLTFGFAFQTYANNYAICVGADFQDGGKYEPNLNTVPAARKANRYLTEAGYDSTLFSNVTLGLLQSKNDDGSPSMSSSILYFNGEGTISNAVCWWKGKAQNNKCGVIVKDYGDSYYQLTSTNFNHVKLAMFMACQTAPMAKYAANNGATASIGFHYNVQAKDMERFSGFLLNRLAVGYTLQEAVAYAKRQTGYTKGTTIHNNIVYGGSLSIASRSSYSDKVAAGKMKVKRVDENGNFITEYEDMPELTEEESPNFTVYTLKSKEAIPFSQRSQSLDEIVAYMKENIDPQFDIDKYKVYISPDENQIWITLMLKIGDFVSDAEYNIMVQNGYVVDISSGGIFDYTLDVIEDENNKTEEELKAQALADDGYEEDYLVPIKQTVTKTIRMEDKRCYYEVSTEYEFQRPEGGIRLTNHEYEADVTIVKKSQPEAEPQTAETPEVKPETETPATPPTETPSTETPEAPEAPPTETPAPKQTPTATPETPQENPNETENKETDNNTPQETNDTQQESTKEEVPQAV